MIYFFFFIVFLAFDTAASTSIGSSSTFSNESLNDAFLLGNVFVPTIFFSLRTPAISCLSAAVDMVAALILLCLDGRLQEWVIWRSSQ